MKIAVTGGSGFVGRSLVRLLTRSGHEIRFLHRPSSDIAFLDPLNGVSPIAGDLAEIAAGRIPPGFLDGCDAVVHSAFWRPGRGFRNAEGDLVQFANVNILGTLSLIEAARKADVGRFVFVSTCAVHEQILDDRSLDEAHPLWPLTHYGAHKAAIEKFVHSFGLGQGYGICAIRPTGIYGVAHPVQNSKWYELIQSVAAGDPVTAEGGGKEIHVDDVARGIEVLVNADHDRIVGQAFACYDRYISKHTVATIAKELSNSNCEIHGATKTPAHEIETGKLRDLGMTFGGEPLLRETIEQILKSLS